jgi:zinc protease
VSARSMRPRAAGWALGLALATLLAAACGDPPPPVSPPALPPPAPPPVAAEPDESFRKTPPPPDGDVVFVPPKIEEARLANGLRVLVTTRRDLPVVAVQLVVRRGADQAKPGLGAFAASLLTQGTRSMGSIAYAEAVKDIGATVNAFASTDATILASRCLTTNLPQLLDLVGEAAKKPLFDKAEIDRERTSRLTTIAQQRDQPGTILHNTMLSVLYPAGHAYAAPLIGHEATVKAATKAELERVYAAAVGPQDAVLAFAGDVDLARARQEAERVFGDWKAAQRPFSQTVAPPAPDAKRPRIVLVERPGATQSQVAVAMVGVPRKTPDFEALLVMNSILGGQFSSRLNMNLREKHAYTYGARSGFDMRLGPGPFTAGGAIETKHTAAAVKEIFAELERIRREPVTAAELTAAKQYLVRQLPARFESAWETASTLATLALYDLPLDELTHRAARIEAVTAEDVRRVAEKYLGDGGRFVVVVADPSAQEGLASLNMGALEVRKAPAAADKTKAKDATPAKAARP